MIVGHIELTLHQILHVDISNICPNLVRQTAFAYAIHNLAAVVLHQSRGPHAHNDDEDVPQDNGRTRDERAKLRLLPEAADAKRVYPLPRGKRLHGNVFRQHLGAALWC